MTENELDEMLDRWKAPPMRNSMREELRAGFAAARAGATRGGPLRLRVRRLAVATIAAAAVVFATMQLSPTIARLASPGVRIPFYGESEFVRYAKDGSVEYRSRMTWFPYGGIPFNMTVWKPENSFVDVFRQIGSSIRTRLILAAPGLVLPKQPPMAEPAWFPEFVRSGCSKGGSTVIGFERLAGHDTTVVETVAAGHRVRIWMAPDLQCFAMRITTEVQEANGTYRLMHRTETLRVTMLQ